MKNGLKRRILAVLIAITMVASQSGAVFAAETDTPGETSVSEGQAGAAEEAEQPSENPAEEAVSENEGQTEAPAESVPSENEVTVSENGSDETGPAPEDVSDEESVSENTADTVFNGMPDGYALSDEQIQGKKRIAEHDVLAELENLKPGIDYVEDEVIFPCDDPEYAKIVAEAYNGTLDSCELGVAVIKLDTEKVTVKQAVAAGADLQTALPPVDANFENYLDDPVEVPVAQITDPALMGSAMAAKKQVIGGRDWAYWRSKGFNDPALDPAYIYNGNSVDDTVVNGYQWMHDAVESYRAWGVTKGEGVTVAVIDTGVNYNHEELDADGKVDSSAYKVDSFKSMQDYSGHGTHVAGIVAAEAKNGKGGTGIAPDAKILAVPVFYSNSYKSADLARGIDYVTNGGKGKTRADVINMSLGGPIYNNTEDTAIRKAYEAGITVCVSMGNDTASCRKYPACYDHVIAVSALDESWQKSDFSTFGKWCDVGAPGTAIFSTWNGHETDDHSKDYNDFYASWNGTSMACPVVSGVCALYISAYMKVHGGEKPTPDEVEEALKKSATKVGGSYKIGAGMVNAANMLSLIENTEAPTVSVPENISSNSVITLSDNNAAGGTLGFIYTVNGKKPAIKGGVIKEGFYVKTSEKTPGKYSLSIKTLVENGVQANEPVKLQVLRITGIGTATDVATENIVIPDTAASYSVVGPTVAAKGKSVTYTLHPGFKKGKIKWSLESGAPAGVTINANSGKVSVGKTATGSFTVAGEAEGKKAALAVKIVDPATSVTLKATGTDKDVNIPVDDKKTGNIKSARIYTVNIAKTTFNDSVLNLTGRADNGAGLVYTSSNPSVAEVNSNGVVTGLRPGTSKITCLANDGSGKKAVVTVTVITPVSRLDMFPANAQSGIAYGKKMKIKPALGAAYGKPTVKKVEYVKEPVKVLGYTGATSSRDVTKDAAKYIKFVNGNLSVAKGITSLGSYGYFDVTVRIKSIDGTNLSVEKTFHAVAPTTKMKANYRSPQRLSPGFGAEVSLFSGDLGSSYTRTSGGYVLRPEVTSSNPEVASAYVSGYGGSVDMLSYGCVLTTEKKGTAVITIKATDGTGKKARLKLIVK